MDLIILLTLSLTTIDPSQTEAQALTLDFAKT